MGQDAEQSTERLLTGMIHWATHQVRERMMETHSCHLQESQREQMHPSVALRTGGESLKNVEGLAGVVSWKDAVSRRTPIRIDVDFVATDAENCLSLRVRRWRVWQEHLNERSE